MKLYSMPSCGNFCGARLLLALLGGRSEMIDCENGSEATSALSYGKLPALHM